VLLMPDPKVAVVPAEEAKLDDALVALVLKSTTSSLPPALQPLLKNADTARLMREIVSLAADKSAPELFPCTGWRKGPHHTAIFFLERFRQLATDEALRSVGARIADAAARVGAGRTVVFPEAELGEAAFAYLAEGIGLGGYRFDRYKAAAPAKKQRVELACPRAALRHVRSEVGVAADAVKAQNLARDFVNMPPSEFGPAEFVREARKHARAAGLEVEILDRRRLEKLGYAGILAVGRGADDPPAMIILRYKPGDGRGRRVALVGKAVMFDSGGYCLKPPKGMWQMKGDMAGGAAVLGAMLALARHKLPISVIGLIPCAKNLVGPASYLPGDIIRTKVGKTIHVTNTDAEGRLLLADALIRAGEERADTIVDIATLTGAVVRALGPSVAGVMGNKAEFINAVIAAGAAAGEAFWELPLVEEYLDDLKSDIADIEHVSGSPNAGTILAALFLREFVPEGAQWAHLDIAGPFLVEKRWHCYGPGATGFGVRTLVQLVRSLAKGAGKE
jgi:leucyl aminopeptidase